MVRSRAYRVLVAFPPSRIARGAKMRGIYRFLSEGANWRLNLLPEDEAPTVEAIKSRLEDVDGIIATGIADHRVADLVAAIDKPTVCIAMNCRARPNLMFVQSNREAIGHAAADVFLSRGHFRGFGYLPATVQSDWSRDRGLAFAEKVAAAGFACGVFAPRADKRDSASLVSWLKSLPLPAAVFAANDYRACDALAACREARLSVPSDIAVIGVDNDPIVCENAIPQLTSVQTDFERQGYLAAQLLHEMMSADAPLGSRTKYVGVGMVCLRDSTPKPACDGRLVQRAVEYINRNVRKGIGPMDVVRHLRVSRRLVEMRFREIRGETILNAILSARLEATRKALLQGDGQIADVCRECGWKSESRPKALFRAKFGCSMRDFRKRSGERELAVRAGYAVGRASASGMPRERA